MTTTARTSPGGTPPEDGWSSKIAFAADPDISFWEKTVKPPGVEGGDPIDTTTMFNTTYRTQSPRSLKSLTNSTARVTYDAEVIDQIIALVNVNGWITIHFPNSDTWDFPGWLKTFNPAELSEGAQPEADIEIVCSMHLIGTETALDFTESATP